MIKQDIKRAKVHEAHNAPAAIALDAAINDPVMVRRRGRMMLPAPQASGATTDLHCPSRHIPNLHSQPWTLMPDGQQSL